METLTVISFAAQYKSYERSTLEFLAKLVLERARFPATVRVCGVGFVIFGVSLRSARLAPLSLDQNIASAVCGTALLTLVARS